MNRTNPNSDKQDHWSVKVNGNWRITFRFIDENIEVLDVNYLDYH
jgi:toxin HigB-1